MHLARFLRLPVLAVFALGSLAACSSTSEAGAGGDSSATYASDSASSSVTATTSASTGTTGATNATGTSATGTGGSPTGPASGPGPASASSTGAGTTDPNACKATAAPGSFYSYEAETFPPVDLEPQPMCVHEGDVLLVVNTAALCGYTPQYTPLQAMHAKYSGQRFKVLGFLSNDFGNQGGTDEQVEACKDQYKVTFPQFAHVKVTKGAGQHPLFTWLTSQPPIDGDVTWNFNKWLISRTGKLVARWTNATEPNAPEIVAAVEAELAK